MVVPANKRSGLAFYDPFAERECKDNTIFILVFLQRSEFYQKIVLFSFFCFIKEPNYDRLYPFWSDAVFRGHDLSCLMCRSTLVPRDEVIIHHGLVAEFEGVAFL